MPKAFEKPLSLTRKATLTGFEADGAVSRSCAFHAQNCAILCLRGESADERLGGIAQIYAVSVSEFVRMPRARAIVVTEQTPFHFESVPRLDIPRMGSRSCVGMCEGFCDGRTLYRDE
jgi:hypothetical protein